jgi:hypothetical protein
MIITAFGSATIISLLLLINAHYFDSIAVAQRTTPRSNETQSLDEDSTSATSESQNLNSEVTNTPTGTVKYLQNSLSRFCHYDLPEYGQNALVFLTQDIN